MNSLSSLTNKACKCKSKYMYYMYSFKVKYLISVMSVTGTELNSHMFVARYRHKLQLLNFISVEFK